MTQGKEQVIATINNDENTIAIITYDVNKGKELDNEISLDLVDAQHIVIASPAQYQYATDFVKKLKEQMGKVTQLFEESKTNAHKAHKSVCELEKKMLLPLQNAESVIKTAMSNWAMEQKRIERENEERIRKIHQAEIDRQLAEAALLETEVEQEEALQQVIEVEEMTQSFTMSKRVELPKGVSEVVDWNISIVNEDRVPLQINGVILRSVDLAAIKRFVKSTEGKVQIPGVYIEETRNIRVRG